MRVEDCLMSDMFETRATISIKAFDRMATLNRLGSKACVRRNAVNVGSRNTEFHTLCPSFWGTRVKIGRFQNIYIYIRVQVLSASS